MMRISVMPDPHLQIVISTFHFEFLHFLPFHAYHTISALRFEKVKRIRLCQTGHFKFIDTNVSR